MKPKFSIQSTVKRLYSKKPVALRSKLAWERPSRRPFIGLEKIENAKVSMANPSGLKIPQHYEKEEQLAQNLEKMNHQVETPMQQSLWSVLNSGEDVACIGQMGIGKSSGVYSYVVSKLLGQSNNQERTVLNKSQPKAVFVVNEDAYFDQQNTFEELEKMVADTGLTVATADQIIKRASVKDWDFDDQLDILVATIPTLWQLTDQKKLVNLEQTETLFVDHQSNFILEMSKLDPVNLNDGLRHGKFNKENCQVIVSSDSSSAKGVMVFAKNYMNQTFIGVQQEIVKGGGSLEGIKQQIVNASYHGKEQMLSEVLRRTDDTFLILTDDIEQVSKNLQQFGITNFEVVDTPDKIPEVSKELDSATTNIVVSNSKVLKTEQLPRINHVVILDVPDNRQKLLSQVDELDRSATNLKFTAVADVLDVVPLRRLRVLNIPQSLLDEALPFHYQNVNYVRHNNLYTMKQNQSLAQWIIEKKNIFDKMLFVKGHSYESSVIEYGDLNQIKRYGLIALAANPERSEEIREQMTGDNLNQLSKKLIASQSRF